MSEEQTKPILSLEFEDVKVAGSDDKPIKNPFSTLDMPVDPLDIAVLTANTTHPAVKDILGFVEASGPISVVIGNTTLKYGYLTLGNINAMPEDLSVNDIAHILLSVDKNGMTLDDYSKLPGLVISLIFKEYASNLKSATETLEFFRRK